jgi:hypothetical protein
VDRLRLDFFAALWFAGGRRPAPCGDRTLAALTTHPAPRLVALALAVTLLNAVKPLTVDDPPYYLYAAHLVQHPLSPYDFQFAGHNPAMDTLAPLVLPYWWAGAIALFGDRPFLWKMALLPFILLLVFALYALCRRFARGLELPLVSLTVLSPALLPSWNLMLDLPALALGLGAVTLFLRGSWPGTVAAGLLAGVAVQTKYTAFVVPVAILLYAVLHRRAWQGLLAAFLAVLTFAAWEAWLAHTCGASHFLHHLGRQHASPLHKLRLVLPLLTILGGVAGAWGLLTLTALGAARRTLLVLSAFLLLSPVALAVVPASWQTLAADPIPVTLAMILFGGSGLLMCGATLPLAARLCRRGGAGRRRTEWFLVLWLGLEVLGYFALSPFPAVRRVLGLVVVGALLAGRLAARTCRRPKRRALVRGAALTSTLLGCAFAAVDLRDAYAQRALAERAARWVRRHDPGATTWYLAGNGFWFYAEREGMRRLTPSVSAAPGDWLIYDDTCLVSLTPYAELTVRDRLPLRTNPCFYGGGSPLEHHDGPRAHVTVYRRSAH